MRQRSYVIASIVMFSLFSGACMDQYNPIPHWEKFKKERLAANVSNPKLEKDGSLPKKPEAEASTSAAGSGSGSEFAAMETKFKQLCATCHGEAGKGDGIAAAGMEPKPRNFTDPTWQKEADDTRIATVIEKGGAAIGKSPTMGAWGAMFDKNKNEIGQMVKYIRSLNGK